MDHSQDQLITSSGNIAHDEHTEPNEHSALDTSSLDEDFKVRHHVYITSIDATHLIHLSVCFAFPFMIHFPDW